MEHLTQVWSERDERGDVSAKHTTGSWERRGKLRLCEGGSATHSSLELTLGGTVVLQLAAFPDQAGVTSN